MISKMKKGADAGGLLRYIFAQRDGEKRAREVVVDLGGTIPGSSAGEMARHVSHLASLRPLLHKNVAHLILRWTADDNPSVIDQQQMAKLHAERLGFFHWRAASHGNHLHIAASRVSRPKIIVHAAADSLAGLRSR